LQEAYSILNDEEKRRQYDNAEGEFARQGQYAGQGQYARQGQSEVLTPDSPPYQERHPHSPPLPPKRGGKEKDKSHLHIHYGRRM
jgi:curved DNA-binding protein CbpA